MDLKRQKRSNSLNFILKALVKHKIEKMETKKSYLQRKMCNYLSGKC